MDFDKIFARSAYLNKGELYFHEYDTLPVCSFLKLNIRNQLLVLALF